MNETPSTVRMIDGATAPAISNVFVNNACAVCTLQITGTFTAATVLVEGIVNVASNQWVTLAAFNLSDLSLEKDGADKAGIYQVGIEGILRVRMNVTEISGGDITIAAQFGNATINQFSKTEASNLIPITAYDLAVAGGYTGTLEQFETDMGNSASNATTAANSADEAAASAESVSASAAQIATNTSDISDLKTQITDITGNEKIPTIPGGYIKLNGETADITDIILSSDMEYAIIPCQEGAAFTVTAKGGSTGRAFGFVDNNGNILYVANESKLYTEYVITAPEHTEYLIVNSYNYPATIYKNKLVKQSVKEINDEIDGIDDELYDTIELPWRGSETYPTGWRSGYYGGSVGQEITQNTSNVYIRATYIVWTGGYGELQNCRSIEFVPPKGYIVQVIVVDGGTSLITGIIHGRDSRDNPDLIDQPAVVEFDPNKKYYVNVGRFNNSDAATKAADSTFCESIKFIAKIAKTENQIEELDQNMARISENLDALYYTEKINFSESDWRTGYYGSSSGSYNSSNVYICTASNYIISNTRATRLTAQAPEGYYIAAFEYRENGTFVKRYGDMKNGTNKIDVECTEGCYYKLSVGRFNNKDAGSYLTSEFISAINVSLDEIKIASEETKLARTGNYEWFTVTCERPLSFGGEEITDPLEEQEIECVLRLPTSYTRNGAPTRLVLACHGASGYVDSEHSKWYNSNWKAFMDELLAAGYAVFDSNVLPLSAGISPDNVAGFAVGSPLYVNVLKKAYDYIVANYNVTKQIFAHGTSMGGVGATAFSHAYPELVLAESSFAGRDILQYIGGIKGNTLENRFAQAYGYDTMTELNEDNFSHAVGLFPSLSIIKYSNGIPEFAPDRVTDYSNWITYFSDIYYVRLERIAGETDEEYNARRTAAQAVEDAKTLTGIRKIPFKSWNCIGDLLPATVLEEKLEKAYNNGNSCPYYTIEYDISDAELEEFREEFDDENLTRHSLMSYGMVYDMIPQLITWYKRWE